MNVVYHIARLSQVNHLCTLNVIVTLLLDPSHPLLNIIHTVQLHCYYFYMYTHV